LQDLKLTDHIAGHRIAGHENEEQRKLHFFYFVLQFHVRHFHILQFHALQLGPSFPRPAISCPAILMVVIFSQH